MSGQRAALAGPGPYQVVDGRILTDGLEVVVTRHCNLRCRSCAYLSPVQPAVLAHPRQLLRDLSILSMRYRASEARVLGGEPLLHPDLVDVLLAIRASGVCDTIRVLTNGLLLPRMHRDFWRAIDEVSISVYPGKELDDDAVRAVQEASRSNGVAAKFKYFNYFRESYSELETRDSTLVRRIYQTCQMANVWRCHTVWEGYLYRCPQSLFIPLVLQDGNMTDSDRIAIVDDAGFLNRLLAFLESPEPLEACKNCLGSVGKLFRHGQIPRASWRRQQILPLEDLLDWAELDMLEENPGMLVMDASYLQSIDF